MFVLVSTSEFVTFEPLGSVTFEPIVRRCFRDVTNGHILAIGISLDSCEMPLPTNIRNGCDFSRRENFTKRLYRTERQTFAELHGTGKRLRS